MLEEFGEGAIGKHIRTRPAALQPFGRRGPDSGKPGRPERGPELRVASHRARHVGIGRHGGDLVLPEVEIASGEFVQIGRIGSHAGASLAELGGAMNGI
jgi:hypothetical protein